MLYTIKKRKIITPFLVIFFISFLFVNIINTSASIIQVQDVETEDNTAEIKDSADKIVKILQGDEKGAQKDNLDAQEQIFTTRKALVDMMQAIVDWVNTGFDGNPAYVTNFSQLDMTDRVVADFLINDPSMLSFCGEFGQGLIVALGMKYQKFEDKIAATIAEQRSQCSSETTSTATDFMAGNFIDGTWDSWTSLIGNPENNPVGAYQLAEAELARRIEEHNRWIENEVNWGRGFLSWQECYYTSTVSDIEGVTGSSYKVIDAKIMNSQTDASAALDQQGNYPELSGPSNTVCTIMTPGTLIANKIEWVDTSGIRQYELASEYTSIAYAIANEATLVDLGSMKATNTGFGLYGQTADASASSTTSINPYIFYNEFIESLSTTTNPEELEEEGE